MADHRVNVRCGDPTVKTSHMCSGYRILHGAVTRKIGAENLARSEICIGHNQRGRKRAPEVGDDAQLKSGRQVGITAKGKLMSAIEQRGAKVATGTGVVEAAGTSI